MKTLPRQQSKYCEWQQ